MPTKILIVEDSPAHLRGYRDMFADTEMQLLLAETMMEGLDAAKANPDVAAIFVDGMLPRARGESPEPRSGAECGGAVLVYWLRKHCRYQGPIIACSSSSVCNRQMQSAGANESCEKGLAILHRAETLSRQP